MVGDLVQAQGGREEDAERRHKLERDQGVDELRPATFCRTNEGRRRGGRGQAGRGSGGPGRGHVHGAGRGGGGRGSGPRTGRGGAGRCTRRIADGATRGSDAAPNAQLRVTASPAAAPPSSAPTLHASAPTAARASASAAEGAGQFDGSAVLPPNDDMVPPGMIAMPNHPNPISQSQSTNAPLHEANGEDLSSLGNTHDILQDGSLNIDMDTTLNDTNESAVNDPVMRNDAKGCARIPFGNHGFMDSCNPSGICPGCGWRALQDILQYAGTINPDKGIIMAFGHGCKTKFIKENS